METTASDWIEKVNGEGFMVQQVESSTRSSLPHLHAFLPADPQIAPGEEAGDGVPGQVMYPTFLSQLCHDGVNPGKTRLGFGPLCQRLHVSVPGDADTDGIALHLVEAGVVGRCCVEELSPQQLAIQRERRGAVLLHLAKTQRSYCTGLALALATTASPPSNTRHRSGEHLFSSSQ